MKYTGTGKGNKTRTAEFINTCTTLKTSVRPRIDQVMRTQNFRVRNEVVERGAVTKNQKGKKAYVARKVGECFQWKSHGQSSKGDSCSFSHEPASGNRGGGQRRKGQSFSPAPNSKAKTDGGEPQERSPCAPKLEETSHEETLHQERCARRVAWNLAKIFTSSRMRTNLRFVLLLKPGQCWRPLQNS